MDKCDCLDCTADNISLLLKNIYKEEELDATTAIKFFSAVQNEDGRNIDWT